jgi:hypothetical protein
MACMLASGWAIYNASPDANALANGVAGRPADEVFRVAQGDFAIPAPA